MDFDKGIQNVFKGMLIYNQKKCTWCRTENSFYFKDIAITFTKKKLKLV